MSLLSSQIYRIIVPKFIRKKILAKRLPLAIMDYYHSLPEAPSGEIESLLKYLSTNPLTVFPYEFQNKYIADDIEVYNDQIKGLHYVLLNGKRLYFKRRWSEKKIRNLFNLLLTEQDTRSPHRYLNDQFKFEEGEVLVDVGAAEGNFALSVVEKASRLILFEADKEWLEPLKATFEPWKEKVLIVNKFVSNVTNSGSTKLDDFIQLGEKGTFIKIDVEGAESKVLMGCERILSEKKLLKIIVCTYHNQNDEEDFKAFLTKYGFKTSYSDGFMLFFYDKKIKAPYFRRGLIRAEPI